eukprot:scaffold26342_cov36-Cyclotella_meneghiniana.AAC.2
MARGARSVSVRMQGLSQAGCCVRAVVVFVMVDVLSPSSSCVFFSVVGGRRSRRRGGNGWLEFAVMLRRMRDSAHTF